MIELLVIMAIIGILVGTSIPALTGYAKQVRLKTTTREITGLLYLARNLAISSREARTVLLDEDHQQLVIEETLEQEEPKKVRLPDSVDVTLEGGAAGTGRVVFQPSGALSSSSVTVVLNSGTKTQTIAVTSATGAISLRSSGE
ncbi:MAG: GspH/FimT family pseudopilin [Candidatus Omnitrophica bacterium]|nr:GspH/FimT family pseudopilin [Candidatus Omnitrophota bacterium]